ncbi:hypothetical protein [Rhodohalobacter mucosus]|uniref:Uncharacterized protein n=1 Tax=Rhodohalobacter mucosus TaxID=2079485 RepID=A0A316TTS7_9BACT|nr:hypothetical protein [Rhodohalobacter mucosus]PWN07041.1 hypothetical protein DDZ15_07160 [Rhodohalobacter mucosus]
MKYSLIILIAVTGSACSEMLNSETEETDSDFMEPMTAALISEEGKEVKGKGIFMLTWSNFNPGFLDGDATRGTAMAIGFEEETLLLPPHKSSTVNMGDVTIELPQQEILQLEKQNFRFQDHTVYSSRSIGPFQQNRSISFAPEQDYTFNVSGSEIFPALILQVTTPKDMVTITAPDDSDAAGHTGDLTLNWDANPKRPVGIMIRPAIQFRKGQKPQGLNRENSEIIILKDQDGTYTLSNEILNKVASFSDKNAVHVSVGQLHFEDQVVDGASYRTIIRTDDHLYVRLN